MKHFFPYVHRDLAGRAASLAFATFTLATTAWAEQHTAGVPELNSRPGADYTVYLNVAGFTYDGLWRGSPNAPLFTPSVGNVPANGTFDAAQVTGIKNIWSRMAQSYIGFNVNVTTVDPAIAAGQAATDAQRQAFYDATPNLMHTVIGSQERADYITLANPTGKWFSTGADGVSGLAVVAGVTGSAGDHTNWMFSEGQQGVGFINGDYIGAISAHENGHAFGLNHQGDWTGNTLINEYTIGDTNPGNGSYVAIIGNAADRQRVAWRVGDTNDGGTRVNINDVQSMLAINNVTNGRAGTANLHLIDDGIGHSLLTATLLPIIGQTVDFSLATGVIVPLSEANPQAIGANNYTKDWFTFTLADTSTITLTAHDSTQFLTAGVADGVGTLRSTLSIYEFDGDLIGTAIEDASTLFETYSGTLPSGTYYAEIASFGGHMQEHLPTINDAFYYDMGAYFLTGSGFVVPEPSSVCFLTVGFGLIVTRRWRRREQTSK